MPRNEEEFNSMEYKKTRYVKYKRVSIAMPHCPVCKEMLSGNNSGISPYECSCGIWQSLWFSKKVGEFIVKKHET